MFGESNRHPTRPPLVAAHVVTDQVDETVTRLSHLLDNFCQVDRGLHSDQLRELCLRCHLQTDRHEVRGMLGVVLAEGDDVVDLGLGGQDCEVVVIVVDVPLGLWPYAPHLTI